MGDATGGTPLFSVLIASYNQAGYIEDTLDSVAAQSFGDYELVVVNDGSTDDTAARVEAWMERFRRTHPNRAVLETVENGGQSAALEHGFGLCAGRYVCLLDSDDLWLPEKLARVAEAVAANPEAGMIVHPLFVIDEAGRRSGAVRPLRAQLSEGDLREQVRRTTRQIAPATTGVTIRADVFRGLLPMPTRGFRSAADSYLTFGASLRAPVRALPEPLGEYRMHAGSMYLRRITTAEGLRQTVELQRSIARHFGIEDAVRNNAYFMRHAFALAKLEGDVPGQLRSLGHLLRSTLSDPSYSPVDKLLFSGFWTLSAPAPRPLFERLWRWFQLRHTGHDRLESGGGGEEAS